MTPATMTRRSRRRWNSRTTKALPSASVKRRGAASCAASASPPISKRAALRPRRRSARSAAASACGNRRGAGQSDRLGRSPHRIACPRPGPRDDVCAGRIGSARPADRDSSIVHGDTDKVQFGMGTYGSRSGAVGMSAIVKALDKIEAKAQEGRGAFARSRRRRHRVQGWASSPSPAPTNPQPGASVALNAYIAAQIHRSGTGAGTEGELRSTIRPTSPSRPAPHLRGRGRSGHRQHRDRRPGPAVDDFGV